MAKRTPEERFWVNVEKTKGCWYWRGYVQPSGYGYIRIGDKLRRVHRYAWELLVGPIPEGLTLDHIKARGCASKACVKVLADEHGPAHLEPVTSRENLLRGDSHQAHNARKTHCVHGHPLSGANLRIDYRGKRDCWTCRRRRGREAQKRRRAALKRRR